MLIENAEELRQETFIPDLQKIHSASETFLGLIKEIVNFSKIKAGIMNAEVGSSETSDMVKGVVSTIRPLSEEDAIFVTADRSAILVVDDNEMNRDLLSRHLERQGHIITIAENGCQTLEIIKNHTFDLILLDVIMPEMDGYELCEEIRKKPEWVNMPIVAVSTHYDSSYIVKALRHGADDYIPKPVSVEIAKKVLNRILTPTISREYHDQN